MFLMLSGDVTSMQTAQQHKCTGVGPGVEHVVQHSIMVHIKPVSYVSQPVRTTGSRQTQVKDKFNQKNK